MASKRYYVRYLESRDKLQVHASDTFVMSVGFNAGLNTSRAAGHLRKSDALKRIAYINQAAGKIIAEYAGAFVPTSEW